MVNGRYPGLYGGAWVAIRSMGWATAAAGVCILVYTVHEWPKKGGVLAAGIVGSGMAMLNDSWIVASKIDTQLNFRPLSHARAVVHDLLVLAVSLCGIVMIVFSRYTFGSDGMTVRSVRQAAADMASRSQVDLSDEIAQHGTTLYQILVIGVWTLTATVLWRFVFVIWGLIDCFVELRTARRRLARGAVPDAS